MAKIDTGLERDNIIALVVVLAGRKRKDGLRHIMMWPIVFIYYILQKKFKLAGHLIPYQEKKSLATLRRKPYVSRHGSHFVKILIVDRD